MKKRNIFLISILCIILIDSYLLFIFGKKLTPKLSIYAESELQKFNTFIINKMIVNEINENINLDDLFFVEKNENKIHSTNFNPIAVNRVLSIITTSLERDLKQIEQGNFEGLEGFYQEDLLKKGIAFMIPSGMVFDNPILSNLGPKIPVRFHLTGNIESKIHTKITNYGINNAFLEVSADVTVREKLILPFFTKTIETTISVPIIMKLIEGNVPSYYFDGIDKNSNLYTLPIQE